MRLLGSLSFSLSFMVWPASPRRHVLCWCFCCQYALFYESVRHWVPGFLTSCLPPNNMWDVRGKRLSTSLSNHQCICRLSHYKNKHSQQSKPTPMLASRTSRSDLCTPYRSPQHCSLFLGSQQSLFGRTEDWTTYNLPCLCKDIRMWCHSSWDNPSVPMKTRLNRQNRKRNEKIYHRLRHVVSSW